MPLGDQNNSGLCKTPPGVILEVEKPENLNHTTTVWCYVFYDDKHFHVKQTHELTSRINIKTHNFWHDHSTQWNPMKSTREFGITCWIMKNMLFCMINNSVRSYLLLLGFAIWIVYKLGISPVIHSKDLTHSNRISLQTMRSETFCNYQKYRNLLTQQSCV